MKSSNKIPKTFIGFLIASFLIWLLITFSKEYTSVIKYNVVYNNIPQDKLLQETPIKKIDVAIKATGFKILRSKIINKTIDLDASSLKRKKSDTYFFLVKDQITRIQKQLLFGVEIQEITQDTLYLNLGLLTSKKVALKPDININYQIGYDLLDKIEIKPDSIIISGPESQIKQIDFLNLSSLNLKDVKTDFSEKVTILNSFKEDNLKFSNLNAEVSGKVDKITEGSLQIPFSTKNLPNNVSLTTLADDVEITFIVALSDFSKVTTASFKVECDFTLSEKNNLSYLIPKVVTKPDFVKSVKIIPTKIDFLIQK